MYDRGCFLSALTHMRMATRDNLFSMVLTFEAIPAEEGGYTARSIGHSIFTEAETWQELEKKSTKPRPCTSTTKTCRPR